MGGPYGAYLTPLATLPLQETGISLGAREGISMEAPLQTGVYSAVPSPFNFGAPIAFPGVLAGGAGPVYAGPFYGGPGEPETGRPISDLIPSYYIGETGPKAVVPSLAEFAQAYKKSHRRAVRVFTNSDAERLSNSVTVPDTAPPHQQQNPPVKPPPQKENIREDRKPELPRSTASVAEPANNPGQP
jgi:hypothetical protein